ncbi:acyl-CoA dehydrogenase family protein [Nocardia bovistercoris]|uniref:Acyl-CoA/acyl-ACP dehydrogenase n=1 Tax=Nocardia bovistercoris TaxID=2785916 RepID=A0A931N3Q5_9NOCA|nr:acyl-CoA dehydrogenase family protein [Nocardia bovistercoris]MBH0776798.1 acyl-CoA/acyl-ACP dehydrogenase [Nocardia bovistercoris]
MITATTPFELSAEHRAIQAAARDLAAEFAPRAAEIRGHLIDHGEMHPGLWERFRANGWAGLLIPSEHGGAEGGLLGAALVLEAFAERGIVLWMPVLSTAVAYAIDRVGPDRAREHWLPRIAAGASHLAMAATEPDTGHNVFGTGTEIRRVGADFVVNGLKRITSGLDVAERVLVLGRTPGDGPAAGFTTLLVDPRAPGATITEIPMGYREGVRQFQLEFDDVAVPGTDLVGAEGAGLFTLWPFAGVERVLTAAICTGTATYCIDRGVARAKERVISRSKPISANQAISHPLAHLHARACAVRLLLHRAAATVDADGSPQAIAAEANAVKLLASELSFDAADHAMRVFGADAWDEREGWLDLYLDTRLSRSGPVSNEFALNHLAEHVLGLPSR